MKLLHAYVVITMSLMIALAATIVVQDRFAIYDQLTMLVGITWVLVNWVLGMQPASTTKMYWYQWLHLRGVWHPQLFVAGLGVILIVIVRQVLQVYVLYSDYIMMGAYTEVLARYAQAVVVSWFIGWSYLVIAVCPKHDYRAILHQHWKELLVVSVLVMAALILRVYALGLIPNLLNGDEGLIGWWATTLFTVDGPLAFVFSAIDGVGTTYLYVMSLVFAIFGQNAMTVRLIPAIAGILSIVTNYWLARQLFGPRVALVTAVLLVFAHTHVHFSRQVAVSYIYSTVFMPIYLWGVWQVVATRRIWPAVVAACGLMLHVNFYLDAWAWAVFLVILVLAWSIVDRHAIIQAIRPLAFMFGLMLVGLSPMLAWAFNNSGEFMSRMSNDGSITTGWLAREAAMYDVSQLYILYTLLEAAILAFLTKPFLDFYHAEVPILDGLSAIVFVVGLVALHLQLKKRSTLLLLGWFWGGITALAILTIPISTYHYRLFAVVPVVYLIIANTYEAIWKRIDAKLGRDVSTILMVLMLVFYAMQNLWIYRTQLAEVCRYGGDLRTQQAGIVSNYLYSLGDPYATVLIYGNMNEFHYGPWMTMDFMNPHMRFVNMSISESPSADIASAQSVYVVVVPEYHHLLRMFGERYNTEQVTTISQCDQPILYVLKAATTQ